jgi:SAM-dependent methyltransferase
VAGIDAERSQALAFGEVANTYDQVRPSYPGALLDEVVRFAACGVADRVLEVGCGTGKATVPLAERGLAIVALEPSPAMAAVARRRCAPFPNVQIETTSLEAATLPLAGFRLVLSAQAWHWVTPMARLERAAGALDPAGGIALFWNRVQWPEDDPVRARLDDVYRRLAPGLAARKPGYPGLTATPETPAPVTELEDSSRFGPVDRLEYPWREQYSTARYLELLTTQSDHRLLADDDRERLLHAVAGVLDDAGGGVTVDYVAALYLARRA